MPIMEPKDAAGKPAGEAGADEVLTREEMIREIDGRFNALTNAINAEQRKRQQSATKELEAALQKGIAPLAEQMAALQPQPPASEAAVDAQKLQQLKYEAELKALRDEVVAQKAAREQEERKRLQQEERAALAGVLGKQGLDQARARAAIALVYTEEQRVKRAEDGKITFRIQTKFGEEQASLEDGVAEWLKTDDGKAFLPPTGAAGAGTSASGRPAAAKKDAKTQALEVVQNFLAGGEMQE